MLGQLFGRFETLYHLLRLCSKEVTQRYWMAQALYRHSGEAIQNGYKKPLQNLEHQLPLSAC